MSADDRATAVNVTVQLRRQHAARESNSVRLDITAQNSYNITN